MGCGVSRDGDDGRSRQGEGCRRFGSGVWVRTWARCKGLVRRVMGSRLGVSGVLGL